MFHHDNDPVLISIEGNIGSGKSTLLKQLRARNPDWHFVDEPVSQWMDIRGAGGESLLEQFYKDKSRWSYTFQNTALLTRILSLRDAVAAWVDGGRSGSNLFITERCIATDAHVFAKLLKEDGYMDEMEMKLYRMWFDAFQDQVPAPTAYVHVDTPVTVCHERIEGRARHGEEGGAIPIPYLDQLDSAHFRWLQAPGFTPPVLRVDNASKDQTPIEKVEGFIRAQGGGRMAEVD